MVALTVAFEVVLAVEVVLAEFFEAIHFLATASSSASTEILSVD